MGEYPENSLATVKQEPIDEWSHTCAPIDLSLKNPGYNNNRKEIPVNLSDRPLQNIVPSLVSSPAQNTDINSINNQITHVQNNERRAFGSSLIQNIRSSWSPIQNTHIGSMNSDRTVLQNIDSGDLFTNSLMNQMPSSELSPVSINSMSSPELPHESQTCSQYEGLASQLAPVVVRSRTMRPFKAFPNNPIAVPIQSGLLDVTRSDKFSRFRSHMLEHLRNHNNSATNKNMRRNTNSLQNEHNTDPLYLEKRKKNNEAAKRSRDARRAKEDEIAIRCAFFEKEYIRLSEENYQTKRQNAELKLRLSSLEANLRPVQRNVYVT